MDVATPAAEKLASIKLPKKALPHTHLRNPRDLPYVKLIEGLEFQLLHADIESGLWVVQTRFAPGLTIPTHKHTGEVFALTFSGSWKYLEYPEVNVAGSYLFEPAGSVHTLHAPSSNTEVTEAWFAIRGANLNMGANDQVESVWDASFISELYLNMCEQQGFERPDVIGLDCLNAADARRRGASLKHDHPLVPVRPRSNQQINEG